MIIFFSPWSRVTECQPIQYLFKIHHRGLRGFGVILFGIIIFLQLGTVRRRNFQCRNIGLRSQRIFHKWLCTPWMIFDLKVTELFHNLTRFSGSPEGTLFQKARSLIRYLICLLQKIIEKQICHPIAPCHCVPNLKQNEPKINRGKLL